LIMPRILKKCCIYFLIPLVISIGSLLFLQLPQYTGEFISKKGYNPVTIHRDKYGIPTIESKTLVDTFYGLGHVHAQDRLWMVNFRRRLYSGRLSEMFGSETIELDKFFRNLSLRRYCEDAETDLDPETKALFQAYIDGFNEYVETLKVLPLEFWITWTTFEPLTLVDTALFGKTISFFLTMDFQYEFIFDTLERLVGHEKAMDILPIKKQDFFWSDTAVVMNDDELKQRGIYEKYNEGGEYKISAPWIPPPERRVPEPLASQEEPKGESELYKELNAPHKDNTLGSKLKDDIVAEKTRYITGSNAWVVHGDLTTTGKPILANDPHLPNNMPSFWYEVALIYEGNFASGSSHPGFAGLNIGKTKDLAWGFTNLCADTTDLFSLKIKGEAYFYDGKWRPLQKFQEKINIRGKSEPEVITVYETHHGVVIDTFAADLFLGMNFLPEKDRRYALGWIGYVKNNTSLKPFNRILSARNAQEFVDTWKESMEPSMSLLFATNKGDIGFIATGRIPIRKDVRQGATAKDGTLKESDWLGYVPWEDQPRIVNPKKGYIVSANNKMASDNVKWGVSANMWTTPRAARIDQMIREFVDKKKKISVDDMKAMQLDTLDLIAKESCASMIKFTEAGLAKGYELTVGKEDLQAMLNRLKTWDYKQGKKSVPASIFGLWHIKFIQKVIKNIGLNDHQREAVIGNFKFEAFLYRKVIGWNKETDAKFDDYWCLNSENKDVNSPCLYNLVKSLEETYLELKGKLGSDMNQWEWGKIHHSHYAHFPFSETPLKPLFHRSKPAAGNQRAVYSTGYRTEKNLDGLWEPNMRMVISLKEGDKSYMVTDTGISENIMSKHYTDQMEVYHRGEWLEMVERMGQKEYVEVQKIKFAGANKNK